MKHESFDQSITEALNYYVYILKDPRNNEIFYIGKGYGNRVFQHAENALEKDEVSDKLDRIRDVIKSGNKVDYYIVRHGLTKDVAHEVEATLIDIFRGKQTLRSDITNKVTGFHSSKKGVMNINEIKQFYGGKEVKIIDPVILININKLYKRNLEELELYNAIRQSRKIGPRRNQAKYVLGHYKGIIREVYEIKDRFSISDHNGNKRWGFNGTIAEEKIREKYINGILKNYIIKGASNPIRYINC